MLCFPHCSACGPVPYLWHTIQLPLWRGNLSLFMGFLTAVATAVSEHFTSANDDFNFKTSLWLEGVTATWGSWSKSCKGQVFCQLKLLNLRPSASDSLLPILHSNCLRLLLGNRNVAVSLLFCRSDSILQLPWLWDCPFSSCSLGSNLAWTTFLQRIALPSKNSISAVTCWAVLYRCVWHRYV